MRGRGLIQPFDPIPSLTDLAQQREDVACRILEMRKRSYPCSAFQKEVIGTTDDADMPIALSEPSRIEAGWPGRNRQVTLGDFGRSNDVPL